MLKCFTYHLCPEVIFNTFTVLISYASDSHIGLQREHPLTILVFSFCVLQASHTHDAITEAAQLMKEAVDDIMVTLNEAASEVGMVGGMVDLIAEAMTKVSIETDPFLTLCLKADPLQSFGQTSTISVVSHEMLSQET